MSKKQPLMRLTYRKSPYIYMPTEALRISEVVKSLSLPYASMLDLVMFQINDFTLQSTNKKCESDIAYISNLPEEIRSRGSINLYCNRQMENANASMRL
jgi:hypothetical protein